jgi:pimeloyl-ACP methyl ester carboxylesterase
MTNSLYKSAEGKQIILSFYTKALSQWPVPYSEQIISTKYGETSVIECGNKKKNPLILLHGASSNATTWIADIAAYSRDFRVFVIDVIGEPGKSAPTRPPLDTDDYAQWLNEIITTLNIDTVSLVGLSQGGWIATRYAISYPNKINKLVLLASAGIQPTKASFLFKAILFTMLGKWGMEKLNRYVFGSQPMDDTTAQYMNAIMQHFTPRMTKEYIFTDQELKRLTMPILYIGGTEDVIRDNVKIKTRLESLLPQVKTEILPHTGHVLIHVTNHTIPFLTS